MEPIYYLKNPFDEKIISSELYSKIKKHKGKFSLIDLQRTGLQRSLLWSTIYILSQEEKGNKGVVAKNNNILLIDEAEEFLTYQQYVVHVKPFMCFQPII